MSTMEDKELQALFAAKRTVEANRRRQEELAAMIANKSKHTRPLWPLWAGAAAASIAILIFALPALFRTGNSMPVETAQAVVPEVTILPESTLESSPAPSARQKTARKTKRIEPIEGTETIETIDKTEPIETIEPAHSIETAHPTEPAAPVRRVMRRTSTLIACTEGCPTPIDIPKRLSSNIQIEFFNNQNFADATIYSFANNK